MSAAKPITEWSEYTLSRALARSRNRIMGMAQYNWSTYQLRAVWAEYDRLHAERVRRDAPRPSQDGNAP